MADDLTISMVIENLSRTILVQKERLDVLERELANPTRKIIGEEVVSRQPRKIVVIAKTFSEVLWMESALKAATGVPVDYAIVRSLKDHGQVIEPNALYVFVDAYHVKNEELPLPPNYLIFLTDVAVAIPSPNVVPMHILNAHPFRIDGASRNALVSAIVKKL